MIGTVLAGRYRVTGLLGGGGMAVVYKATDQVTGETVAVKALRSEYVSDGAFLRRLRREAEAVRRLSHPGVVAVLDVGEDAGHPFLVLEYVEGITLKQHIREKAPLPLREAVHIACRVLSVLQHAHENGVIHRDVKPQNILITPDARVMVTDFGIARASGTTTTVVDQGAMVGTAQYFAPEQARGMPASERSDVYAVGIILFEMLTGRLPFDGDTPVAVAMQHLGQEPPLPSALNPQVPRGLEAIVLKALEKNPDRRYPSAGAMLDDLENFLAGRPVAALARHPVEDTLVAGHWTRGAAAARGPVGARSRSRYGERWIAGEDGSGAAAGAAVGRPDGTQGGVRTGAAARGPDAQTGAAAGAEGPQGGGDPQQARPLSGDARKARDGAGRRAGGPARDGRGPAGGRGHDGRPLRGGANGAPAREGPGGDGAVAPGRPGGARSSASRAGEPGPEAVVPAGAVSVPAPADAGRDGPGLRRVQEPLGGRRAGRGRARPGDPGAPRPGAPGSPAAGEGVPVRPAAGAGARRRRLLRVALAVFLLLVLAMGAGAATRRWLQPPVVTVPTVEGLPLIEAQSRLEQAGLQWEILEERYDNSEVNTVIEQRPAGGEQVRMGQAVQLVVSKGPQWLSVPDVRGLEERDARLRLENQGLVVEVRYSHADEPEGVVVDQDPGPGSPIQAGMTVYLTVSQGPESRPVTVPSLFGLTVADARAELEAAGLVAGQVKEQYSPYPAGTVIGQDPAAGGSVEKGTAVDLVVSRGPEPAPPLAGGHAATVVVNLQGDGQHVLRVEVEDETGRRVVHEQTHQGGERVEVPVTWQGDRARALIYVDGQLVDEQPLKAPGTGRDKAKDGAADEPAPAGGGATADGGGENA